MTVEFWLQFANSGGKMNNLWSEDLTEEQAEELIQKLANQIIKRRMQTPAILFLEMHKPLANLAGHTTVAFSPFLIPFLGFQGVDDYSRLMKERRNWDRLIDVLDSSRETPPQEPTISCSTTTPAN